eukprot:Clim_evm14s21 gene=Clim_evmTU14s21
MPVVQQQETAANTAAAAKAGAATQANTGELKLKGSTEMVAEFFGYAINNILYQRGIYPADMFIQAKKYGLTLMVANDPELQKYMSTILTQLKEWLLKSTVQSLVVVISSIQSGEPLERWSFQVDTAAVKDAGALSGETAAMAASILDRSEKDIQKDIQALIRQITASVTFLPLLDEPCAFDLLIYTDLDTSTPHKWEESGPRLIKESEDAQLRSFTTTVHRIGASVSFAR